VELGRTGDVNADDQHIVHIVDWLLQYAYEQRASDIHLEPRREMGRMRFRIDGVLHKVFEVPPAVMTAVVSRIKVLGRMDLAERRRPQDGRIKTRSPGGREVEMRLSTMPTAFGEKCVMRIFDPDAAFKSIDQLGFSPQEAAGWNALVERPHGIVLVTGPTGSGKTTTLYSTLKRLATPDVNVCTVEDPIEMIAPEFNQMQVQANIDLDFASGVRTLLRQDPDIIMIGEIRDLETAQMAVQASLTGHLVLSTLHTNDAPRRSPACSTWACRTTCWPAPSTASSPSAWCARCARTASSRTASARPIGRCWLIAMLHIQMPPRPVGRSVAWSAGAPDSSAASACMSCCHWARGCVGRSAPTWIWPVSPVPRAEGLRTLRQAGLEKVAQGLTTIEEVLSVLPPPDEPSPVPDP
jgi:general secretion pathway protein E